VSTINPPLLSSARRFRLPENCANLTFGGPKRNFLFMTASQSIYAVQLQAQGAAPG
jgi:gluconolactonase